MLGFIHCQCDLAMYEYEYQIDNMLYLYKNPRRRLSRRRRRVVSPLAHTCGMSGAPDTPGRTQQ
jgi:hypothetical protein